MSASKSSGRCLVAKRRRTPAWGDGYAEGVRETMQAMLRYVPLAQRDAAIAVIQAVSIGRIYSEEGLS